MSFNDMMESGRGPGVIGMLLAMVVLAGFVLFYIFAFDEGMQGGKSISAVIAHQAEEIANIKLGISQCDKELQRLPVLEAATKKVSELKRENQFRDGKIASLKDGVASGSAAVSALAAKFDEYKDDYRKYVRGLAKGRTLARLETRSGKTYENVTIREVTAIGAQIRDESGLRRVPYEELPDEMQEEFQFDANQKVQAMAAESAARNQHESAVSAAIAAAKGKSARQQQESEVAAHENAVRALAVRQSQVESLKEEIRALEQAIRDESHRGISRAPQMRDQLEAKRKTLSDLQVEVVRLRNSLQ